MVILLFVNILLIFDTNVRKMMIYGTHLSYLCKQFLLKESGAHSVQDITIALMPTISSKRERRNAQNRVRRALDQLVFEREVLKAEVHLNRNILVFKYSIHSYESESAKSSDSPISAHV